MAKYKFEELISHKEINESELSERTRRAIDKYRALPESEDPKVLTEKTDLNEFICSDILSYLAKKDIATKKEAEAEEKRIAEEAEEQPKPRTSLLGRMAGRKN